MRKIIYLNDDDSIAGYDYMGDNREEWDFMSKHCLGDGTVEGLQSKEKQAGIIKMYEERFPIKVIYKHGCIYKGKK